MLNLGELKIYTKLCLCIFFCLKIAQLKLLQHIVNGDLFGILVVGKIKWDLLISFYSKSHFVIWVSLSAFREIPA